MSSAPILGNTYLFYFFLVLGTDNKSSSEKGSRQTSIGKHCEDQELRYCGMHFLPHNFTKTNISFFLEKKDSRQFVSFKEDIYSSQESNKSTEGGGEEEEELSKSSPTTALTGITAAAAILT